MTATPKETALTSRIAGLSPEKQALLALRLKQKAAANGRTAIGRAPLADDYPLSLAQQRLWVQVMLEPDNPFYNIRQALRLNGGLSALTFENAIDHIRRRQESLRTRFYSRDGVPRQIIDPVSLFTLPVIDLSGLDQDTRSQQASRLAEAQGSRPFRLELEAPVRFGLTYMGSDSYIFLMAMHHIISDGWSMEVLVKELWTIYAALSKGRQPALTPLPIRYVDYAVWQRNWLSDERLARSLDYWKTQLASLPLLQLPTDRPRPAVQSYRGNRCSIIWRKDALDRLRRFCRGESVTLYTTLLAAFQVLLSRYTGQRDIVVGTDIANRNKPAIQSLIGFFINQLVMRTDLSGDPCFNQVLKRVKKVLSDAQAHQDFPFDKLVRALGVERDLSHNPLFQVKLVYMETAARSAGTRQIQAEPVKVESHKANFDMTLSLLASPEDLIGSLEYSTDLFDEDTVVRFLHHLHHLLDSAVTHPEKPLSKLQFLRVSEQEQILHEWNDTDRPLIGSHLAHGRFEFQVDEDPNASAIWTKETILSYGELEIRANQVAHTLRDMGVGPEVPVGLFAQRGIPMITAFLGILKAGGVYVPLDTAHPLERIAYIMEDSGIAVVIAEEATIDQLPPGPVQVLCMDGERDRIMGAPEARLDAGVHPFNLAYVIFTSGSTGRPKGVQLTHRGLCNMSQAQIGHFNVGGNDRVLQFTTLSFDASVFEIVMALLSGATLCPAHSQITLPGAELAQHLNEAKITNATLPPAALAALPGEPPQSLQTQISAGEALPGELVKKWAPGRRFFNAYGPTETTVWASLFRCKDGQGDPPIGRPIDNTKIFVLDPQLKLLPIGIAGELHIGGMGLARGYLHKPAATAQSFIPNPYGKEPGDRLYKTGDLVRYLPTGDIRYLDRIDFQVKIRGFRIELNEIEAVLLDYAGLKEAVVIARAHPTLGKQLIAYITLNREPGPSSEALAKHLSESLPDYMIPSLFITLKSLPLLPSGKINRSAMPDPEATRNRNLPKFTAPRTQAERILTRIWADVLGRDRVGIHDNFFEMGGDSILGIQAVSRAAQQGLEISTKEMFQYQTVAELVTVAATCKQEQIDQGPVTGPLPLTPIQTWFFQNQGETGHHYNQSILLKGRPKLEPLAISKAVNALADHHDLLRQHFLKSEGQWQPQIDSPGHHSHFSQLDLTKTPSKKWTQTIENKAAEVQAGFQLQTGPLFRALLFQMPKEEPDRLLLVTHHLCVDGVSWRILLQDLHHLYHQFQTHQEPVLPAKTESFQKWAEALAAYGQSESLAAQVPYWKTLCQSAATNLPIDEDGGENLEMSRKSIRFGLTPEETRQLLEEVPSAYRTHINDVLLTALAMTLAEWTGQQANLVDLETHGREALPQAMDVTRTVGWFTSYHPVCLRIFEGAGPGGHLKQVKEALRSAPAGGEGYMALKFGNPGSAAKEPLAGLPQAQVLFNYLGRFDQTLEADTPFLTAAENKGPARGPQTRRTHLLEVNGQVAGGRLTIAWDYSQNKHHERTIHRLANRYFENLRALIDHCTTAEAGGFTPSDFPLARISQRKLDLLYDQKPNLEDIYPLSPMQQGMLFHTLYESDTGAYGAQTACSLEGAFDPQAFRDAWVQTLKRHPVLRTAFLWDGVDQPLQIVYKTPELPLEEWDWRSFSNQEQDDKLKQLLEQLRSKPFDLAKPPLLELCLIRRDEGRWHFVMSFHHIVADGWSWPVVLQDVFQFYAGARDGEQPRLETVRPFRDYIGWLAERDQEAAETYWRETLKGWTAPTPLGLNQPGLTVEEGINPYDVRQQVWHAAKTHTLQETARRQRLTVNTLVQGCWALLLSHYNRETEVVFGATVSGRPAELSGSETMVGLFINTLPLRVAVAANCELWPWFQGIQDHQSAMLDFQYTPLTQIQGWSQVPRAATLFESIVVFEKYPTPVEGTANQADNPLKIGSAYAREHTHYPIAIEVAGSSEMTLRIVFDRRHFEPETVDRILGHFETVLEALTTTPPETLGQVPILPESERHLVLETWNQTRMTLPDPRSFLSIWSDAIAQNPETIAASFHEGRWLTYADLDRRSDRLAAALKFRGVEPETLVGILADRNIPFLAAMLAIFKLGAIYLPLDPHHPCSRLAQTLEQSKVSVVLTCKDFEGVLDETAAMLSTTAPPVTLNLDQLSRETHDLILQYADLHGKNPAYVIFTSGSTGVPKGAAVHHGGMLNHLFAKIDALTLCRKDVIAQNASQCFDISVWQFLAPLMVGARVHIMGDEIAHNPAGLFEETTRQSLTILETVPSMLAAALDMPKQQPQAPLALRWLVPTGEALPPELCRRWLKRYPGIPMLNAYGPTECSDDVTHHPITEAPPDYVRKMPIGKPVPNTRLYVLDDRLQPVAMGAVGELCVAGVQVGLGYLHDEKRTRTSFVTDPFCGKGDALYKTGDLGRFLSDGSIEFLGRKDHQVKMRGFRIELGEIEAVLGTHPSVREAAVQLRQDEPGQQRLVAYPVAASGMSLEEQDLKTFLKDRLPEYMVPTGWVTLDTLPLTANGKIDRKSLPHPPKEPEKQAPASTPPPRPTEELVTGIWRQVLKHKQVLPDDDFFALGGHSLLATQVIARVRATFNLELPLRFLFEAPTVRKMVTHIEKLTKSQTADHQPLVPVPRDQPLPLSFAQQRLWFVHRFEPESPFYNIPRTLAMDSLDVAAIEAAFDGITARHEILRTRFIEVDDQPVQVIDPPTPKPMVMVDLTGLSDEDRQRRIPALAAATVQKAFHLETGPVMRVALFRSSLFHHNLVFSMHHIAGDGWSMGLLTGELKQLYEARISGVPAKLKPLPIQYADYAVWQRRRLTGRLLEQQIDYWRNQLAHPEPLALPLDRPRPLNQRFSGGSMFFELGDELSDAVRALCQQEGTTLYMTLLAAYQTLLFRATGQADISVGSPIAGRDFAETEGLIGFFINTLVMRSDLSGDPNFSEFLARVREMALNAYAHQDVPFEKLVEVLLPERDLSRTPLFQVMFVMENAPREDRRAPDLASETALADTGTSKFDLTLLMVESRGSLVGGFQYNSDLFDQPTIARFGQQFQVLLQGITENPDRPLSSYPLTEATEQYAMVGDFMSDMDDD